MEIVTGLLPPGTLLKDAEIAARLGLSITPVREAISHLAAEGLIDIAPNRSRRVTRVTEKNALELIDVMGILACAGFDRGAVNLTSTDLELLRDILLDMETHLRAGDRGAGSAAAARFSAVIILASGNRELQTLVDLVVARTVRLNAMYSTDASWMIWVEGYRETLELLNADDLSGASDRYRQIFDQVRQHLEQFAFSSI
jgi:DNA-binding GntR family transcriptional regulator